MRHQHIVFDLDGTLIDTENAVLRSWQLTASDFGLMRTAEQCRGALGVSNETGLERLGITDDGSFMRRWVEHYAELAPSTHWFEGAEKMLDDLSGAGFTLGIVTSRDALEMDRFFSQYDLPSRFGTIVIADDTPLRCKPLSDPLLLYCERTGTSPRNCIYIGDAPGDAKAARSAGMDFALVDFSASHAPCAEVVSFFQSPAALKRYLLEA